ncbi:MAG TPA: hydrogenase maturation nickel metallochaperone HypA [Tepidisphaeraceae bacterium]|jgi:hydrogenase nickel incorporation protein HypA/HybF|nr:hydrogenase maturation nickel metallochaperone HypA [Tepidisphaeraceae bacterium]
MHELSIAISLLDVAAEEAQNHGGGRVLAIYLRLGPLSGVVSAALLSAFELARESEGMEQCRLLIEETPIVLDCAVCQGPQPARSIQEICCATCGTPTMNLISGRELEVTAMELSDEHANASG